MTSMGPTGVVVRVWSSRGCVTSMGLTGVVVRVWVLQGLCDEHGSYMGGGT